MPETNHFTEPMFCNHCSNTTVHRKHGAYTKVYEDPNGLVYCDCYKWSFFECSTCNKPSLYQYSYFTDENELEGNPHFFEQEFSERCKETALYPIEVLNIPEPHKDMPKDLINDYNEAKNIFLLSPRSSAALLRLVLQKLCVHLGQPGKKINDDIKSLVEDGLPTKVQRALDSVRVIGNNAVHPGQININDRPEIALSLFKLINFIVDEMITRPREINDIYDTLPESSRKAIEERDKNN